MALLADCCVFEQVREELRMYNPEYTSRPHVVVLNKMDMEDAYELEEELRAGILAISKKYVCLVSLLTA